MPSLSFASLKDNIAVAQPLCGLVNNNSSQTSERRPKLAVGNIPKARYGSDVIGLTEVRIGQFGMPLSWLGEKMLLVE